MEQSFGLLFFLKKPMGYQTGETSIYLRIMVDGSRVELSLERKCDPAIWNQDAGRVHGKKDEVKTLNAYLSTIQEKVYEAKRQLIDLNKDIIAEAIRNVIIGREAI